MRALRRTLAALVLSVLFLTAFSNEAFASRRRYYSTQIVNVQVQGGGNIQVSGDVSSVKGGCVAERLVGLYQGPNMTLVQQLYADDFGHFVFSGPAVRGSYTIMAYRYFPRCQQVCRPAEYSFTY